MAAAEREGLHAASVNIGSISAAAERTTDVYKGECQGEYLSLDRKRRTVA